MGLQHPSRNLNTHSQGIHLVACLCQGETLSVSVETFRWLHVQGSFYTIETISSEAVHHSVSWSTHTPDPPFNWTHICLSVMVFLSQWASPFGDSQEILVLYFMKAHGDSIPQGHAFKMSEEGVDSVLNKKGKVRLCIQFCRLQNTYNMPNARFMLVQISALNRISSACGYEE